MQLAKIIKFSQKIRKQKKIESEWAYSEVRLAKIIKFPQKSPERKKFDHMLNRSFGSGDISEELLDELWRYTQGIAYKFKSLRSGFNLPLPDTLSEIDTAVISAAAQRRVDVFIDKGHKIFREMLREIILLRLALYKSKRSF